ncbi:heavy metal translocating P-type ATPase [Natrialba asiatica]|uniref:ATPase P n=1 Tax=Natrialba asiatica (strain ATCC 700177 / DSM 12278 / JCM 9576 / FERM P-10747 / NBRC 102637 / 172P1) TaxID=29540 RepID=M0B2Q6_NATA1|nr:cation-translocating P-type ATPase [Natrialba asiatica]ELZ03954.1 ATPase P [Natrialba asiatica DSM 12278]
MDDDAERSTAGPTPGSSRCRLCGTALTPAESDGDEQPRNDTTAANAFCSTGCRQITETLAPPEPDERNAAGSTPTVDTADESAATSADATAPDRTFLRVDGMYAATCERHLESVAKSQDGVTDAAASYVTETIRIDHDPARISAAELEAALTTTGYTAYRREEASSDAETGGTRRSREMSGLRKRRTDDMLEVRYVIGIVFGSFLLIPYAALLYPTYLASVFDWRFLSLYDEAFTGFGGLLFLPLFFTVTGAVLYLTGMPLLRGAYVSLRHRQPSTQLLASLTVVSAFCYGTIAFVSGRSDLYYDLTIIVAAIVMAALFYEAMVKRQAMDRLTELTISQVDTARVFDSAGSEAGDAERTSDRDSERASTLDDSDDPGNPDDLDDSDGPDNSGDSDDADTPTAATSEPSAPSQHTRTIPVTDLSAGDRLLVRAGERIPVDGELVASSCTVDEAVVTGESLPISKTPGDAVVGGSVVTGDAAIVAVGDRTDSSIDRLTRTVWNLQSAAHGIQRRADELAAIFLPVVLGAGALVGAWNVFQGNGLASTTTVLAVLLTIMVASPWALGLATPYSVASSIREAMDRGIVVFDETVFERLREIDTVVFDKTGTLTTGEMTVLEADGSPALLRATGRLERHASHPAAAAITAAFASNGGPGSSGASDAVDDPTPDAGTVDDSTRSRDETDPSDSAGDEFVREFTDHGNGVSGVVDGDRLLVGHPDLFDDRDWDLDPELGGRASDAREAGNLPVVIGRNGRAEGLVVVGDEPRDDWEETVTALSESDVSVVVLTGDEGRATETFAQQPGVDHVFTGVPPDGKTEAVRRLRADGPVAMVGDGTNDAPALAAADLGLSLGGGTALASDAADLAIVDDDLSGVERAFALARTARRRVVQNLALALSYNAIVVPLALTGLLNPLFTAVAVGISSGLIVLNSSRSLRPA